MTRSFTTGAPEAPGWQMSQDQRRLFWRLWAAACECQGWNQLPSSERDEKRHAVLAELGFASIKTVDGKHGFDALKRRLQELADKVHVDPPDQGLRRRILWRIGQVLLELRQAGYPDHAVETILKQRFKVLSGVKTMAQLATPELVNLSRTLTARLASWKAKAPPPNQLNALPF